MQNASLLQENVRAQEPSVLGLRGCRISKPRLRDYLMVAGAYDAEILRKATAPVASETARDAQAFPHELSAAHERPISVEIRVIMSHS